MPHCSGHGIVGVICVTFHSSRPFRCGILWSAAYRFRTVITCCGPIVQRIQQFAINQVSHIHGADGPMVFNVVNLVQIAPSVGFLDARKPALVPNGRNLIKRSVALKPDGFSEVKCPVESLYRCGGIRCVGSNFRRFQFLIDLREILEHLEILPTDRGNGEKHFQVVPVKFCALNILVQQIQQLIVLRQVLARQFQATAIFHPPVRFQT